MIIAFFSCQSGANKKNEEAKTPVQDIALTETTINVGGMSCENCVKSVEKGINELQGVAEVKVSLSDSIAYVKFDGSKLTIDDINKAIEGRGYTVKSDL